MRGYVLDEALQLFGLGGSRWAKNQTVHPDVGVAADGVQIDAAAAWRRDTDLELAKVRGPSQLAQGIEQCGNLLDVTTEGVPAAGLLNGSI